MRSSLFALPLIFVVSAGVRTGFCAPYDFRRQLEEVHRTGRRDVSQHRLANEFAFADGATITVGASASDFLRGVARDFEDYLDRSMAVSARVVRGPEGTVSAKVDAGLLPRQYRVDVTADGVRIRGADERAVAQAFYHLEDVMNLRRAPFLSCGETVRRPRFSVRMTFPGYGFMTFPEPHLNAMAHAGMTAIVVLLEGGVDRTEGGRSCDVRAIIRRAVRYGLDTYICFQNPPAVHPDDGEAAFDRAFGSVAAAYPEAKGVIFVGESCNFPSKDPRVRPYGSDDRSKPRASGFPCSDYPAWIDCIQKAFAKHAPGMKAILWTYNWGGREEDLRLAMVERMRPGSSLMATFEMFERRTLPDGMDVPTADYSISIVGPGRYFTSEATAAKRLGLNLFTQANAGGRTWDFGTAPYEPFPHQWRRRWEALVRAHDDYGLMGVFENWEYGWIPTFLAELEKEAFTEGGLPFDAHLRRIAERDFGSEAADAVVRAWALWSEAIADYVASDANQYGPFRCGPAYPFSAGRGKVDGGDFPVTPQSFVGTQFIRMNYLGYGFTRRTEDLSVGYMKKEVGLLAGMAEKLDRGADAFAAVPGGEARRQLLLGRYLAAVCRTARNVKRGWIAASEKDEAALLAAARDEYANARGALALVEEDSILGFEPIMDYVGGPDQIRWKLGLMEKLYGDCMQ